MYLCYVSKLFILFLMCQDFLLYFTTIRIFMYPCFYSISPYYYVYVSKLLALFHYTVCYVSKLFILFPMCQDFLLYFTILFLYIYVSMLLLYFTEHINHARLCIHTFVLFHHTPLHVCYVSKLFILFPMCQDFLLYFTILLCVYVSMFLFYFTIYINHICYVSKLLTLFHHITFLHVMYPYIHVFAYEH